MMGKTKSVEQYKKNFVFLLMLQELCLLPFLLMRLVQVFFIVLLEKGVQGLLRELGLWMFILLKLSKEITQGVIQRSISIVSLIKNRKKESSKSIFKSKIKLSKWIHQFLSDEEKAAILIDYRIFWYGDKRPNKFTRFKVWLKTLHYLFYEVWFKERLDKIKSFQIKMPRW